MSCLFENWMERQEEMSTTGLPEKIWVAAPWQNGQLKSGSITGVWIDSWQTVEWIWSHGPFGSYITGYTISQKPIPETYMDKT